MSAFKEYALNPSAETYRDLQFECERDFEPPAPPPCIMCPHFVSSEFPEGNPHYDIGLCEAFALALHANGESMGEAIVLADCRTCYYHEWKEVCTCL